MFDFGGGGSKREDSKLGFGVPSLSLGNPREALGKATNTLRNTGEKVENFLFGHHGSRAETHTESSGGGFGLAGKGGLSLGFNVPSLGTPNLPKVSKLPKSPHGFGLPSLSNLGRGAKNDLEKAGSAIENTGKKAIDFLFGGREKTPSLPSLGINARNGKPSVSPNGISLDGNLGSAKANDTSFGLSLGKGKSSIGGSITFPNLTGVGSKMKNDLGRVEGAIENAGKNAIDFLFGREKGDSSPGIDLNAPSIPPLGISSGEGNLGLPNLPKGNLTIEHNLERGISSPGLSLDIQKGNLDASVPLGVNINGTTTGNLGGINANGTSLGISVGNGKSSISASFSLPNLSSRTDNLDKVEGAIENTGKKAIDFLFGREKGDSSPGIDLNAPSIPPLGVSSGEGNLGLPNLPKGNLTIKHNLEKGTSSPGLSLDIQKGNLDASVPLGVNINGTTTGNLGGINANGTSLGISVGNGKSSIGASLSLPNLSTPTDNLDKVGDTIENTGKKAIHFIPSLSNPFPDVTTSNKQKETTNIPVGSTLEGNVYGSIGLPGLPLGEKRSTPGGSDGKPIGLPELNLPKLGRPVSVDLGSTKSENTYTNIPLSGLANSSSRVGLTEGSVSGTPPVSLSTTDHPFTATLNPLFEELDKIFYTNNITITDDGTTSFGSTHDDEIAEADYEQYDSSTYNYNKTTSTEDSSRFSESSVPFNTSTENYSIFNGNGNGFSIPNNITTESEKDLKKIEEILRGSFDANSPTSSSNGTATRKKENNVTSKPKTVTLTTESIKPVQSSTLEYRSNQTSTTEQPKKTKPAVIPPYFLVPNSNVTFGEGSEPILPPSVFDNPTGEKAPFIPILPSSPNNHMGPYNLTDRGGVSPNSSAISPPDNLSAVTYGAIGVGAIAIISIIIAFIYKAIKKARRSSSGGSYSPKSHHKEQEETRRSSSNSEGNEGNSADKDSQVDQTIITHALINETTAESKNIRNVKSRAPDPHRKQDEIPDENSNRSDLNYPGPSNTEVLNFEMTNDPDRQIEKIQQQNITKKDLSIGDEVIIHEQNILKKNIIPIDKPPRKNDKANASTGKFTSDKTAASNLNEDSLRSLGQALGGILKDQMPELDGNHKVGTANIKKEKDFANDSDELTSCTPPTTPTDLSDQETTKNDNKVEENKPQKKSYVSGGEADGDAFFSSGEIEVDTGSEYFSADESTFGVRESNARSPPVASHSQGTYPDSTLSKENGYDFVTEEGRRKSIEEDIADSLKISTKSEEVFQEKVVTTDAVKIAGHHRCISMCEDQIIDMEVQEILKGKEPYQLPSENSSSKDSANSAEFQTYNQEEMDAKDTLEGTYLKNTITNEHLQNIIDSGTTSKQNNSGLDANTVVDEIMSTSKVDFLDTELKTSGKIQNIETEGTKVHLEENIMNLKNSNQDFFIQSKTTILDVEISGETFSKINDESSKTTDTPEHRNLIDYIIPKSASIETASFDGRNPSKEDQRIDDSLVATNIRETESTTNTPKWYIPFESSPQELTDPSRGNSDGLYIALSDETKLPQVKIENQTPDFNSTSGAIKKSCAYININGDRSAIDEGWPSHLPKNHHENNMSGLGLLNTVSPNGHRCIIHEEASSNKRGKPYNEISELLSRQAEVSVLTGEKAQEEIPNFELPNMDKRLTRKKNLKRRQIKSLDSGVHGYYGEYIDLVEFPELEGGQKITQDEEQKTNDDIANKNEIMQREIEEIKIEEDVVTILPDGSIREEKIVIDKISST